MAPEGASRGSHLIVLPNPSLDLKVSPNKERCLGCRRKLRREELRAPNPKVLLRRKSIKRGALPRGQRGAPEGAKRWHLTVLIMVWRLKALRTNLDLKVSRDAPEGASRGT